MGRSYDCPVELALDVLGGKWRVVLLARLKEGPQRYSDLRRLVPRMSDKMLTQRLRELGETGLIARRAGKYSLTSTGASARRVLQALYDWGQAIAPSQELRLEVAARKRSKR
jgi:DNA-binding HxlR family transcriptional regulator